MFSFNIITLKKVAAMNAEFQHSTEPSEETRIPETTSTGKKSMKYEISRLTRCIQGEDVRPEQQATAERTEPEPEKSPRSGRVRRGSVDSTFPENPGPSINLWEMMKKRRSASPLKGRTRGIEGKTS